MSQHLRHHHDTADKRIMSRLAMVISGFIAATAAMAIAIAAAIIAIAAAMD